VKKQVYTQREAIANAFKKYIPEMFIEMVIQLFAESAVQFKIVNGRKTKLGDFRAGMNGEKHRITVNGDLNPYAFLITTLHEFAHLITYNMYQQSAAPHGEEWKAAFRKLLIPVINSGHLPKDIEHALVNSLVSMKASSCSDIHLSRVLQTYDKPKEGVEVLERLSQNTTFTLNGRHFVKGPLRRKRFICKEVNSKKEYLVSALAQVYPVEIKN
jgi:SprT protein